jgi:hypothetical protein
MNMKNELIEFVSLNFEAIKRNFLESEYDIIEDVFEDNKDITEIDKEELIYFLENQLLNATTAKELIDVINERSIGIDLNNNDECTELFKMIEIYV